MNRALSLVVLLLSLATAAADEASWDFSGNVELEGRLFTQDPRWFGQESRSGQYALAATAEFRWRNGDGNQRASIIPFARWDATDDERSLVDLKEAYWAYEGDSFELLVGANTVFWGVTESVHLVDIINQTDFAADIDGEDKLGQPMVNLAVQRDWGLVSLYAMPYFRDRTYAGTDGRFRAPLPVDTDAPEFEASNDERHVDLALRYSHYIGDVDLGLSVFTGTSREPRLVPSADGTRLLPYYEQIDQFGVDLQYTTDAWLWKLEAIVRDGFDETFAAAVGGFEYTRYQVFESAADLGFLLEYQYDGRGDAEPLTLADNDVFVGTRLALNDVQDTAVLAGAGIDVDTGETFFNVEAERRFGDDIVIELRLRALTGADPEDRGYAFGNDDYVELNFAKFF